MDCTEARYLIDQGIAPGSRTAATTQLGFHLARCAACRAYRDQQTDLLSTLLLDQQPVVEKKSAPRTPAPIATPRVHAPFVKPAVQADIRSDTPARPVSTARFWSRSLWLLASVVAVSLLVAMIWVGGILVRAQMNIASYVVPTSQPQHSLPTPQAVAGGVGPIAAGPLIGLQATASPQPSPSSPPDTHATGSAALEPQDLASTTPQVIARRIVTATSWPTLEPAVPIATSTPEIAVPPAGEAFTVLILGNDRRPGEAGIPRTDVVMLARIDPQRGHVALLSFPRDLWVAIPDYGQTRINAAYVWGETYAAPGGGLGLAKATVSNLIGRPIDYVAMIDFEGFIKLIDSIGGVTVDVDKELDDPQFPTMDYGYTHAYFAPGPQHMDGVTALTYSRIRHPDSDFARIKRQQAVLVALGQRLQERGDLQNLLAADTITASLRGYIQTDMPQERILGAVWALRSLDRSSIHRYTLDADRVVFGVGADRYAETPIAGAIEELTRLLYGE